MARIILQHAWLAGILLVAMVSAMVVLPACSPTSTLTGTLLNGQDIFLTGRDASGVIPTNNSYGMMGHQVACADCHGSQGHGGTVTIMMTRYDVPNITWPELTGATYTPPYTVETVKQAITKGLDQVGEKLKAPMPQWSMSTQDLDDLVGYIQTLK